MKLVLPAKAGPSAPRGGASGTAPPPGGAGATPRRESTADGGSSRIHVVADGDRLESIAKDRYGRSSEWTRIFAANRELLGRPEGLRPGMKLKIP